jgi:hypothetical protein
VGVFWFVPSGRERIDDSRTRKRTSTNQKRTRVADHLSQFPSAFLHKIKVLSFYFSYFRLENRFGPHTAKSWLFHIAENCSLLVFPKTGPTPRCVKASKSFIFVTKKCRFWLPPLKSAESQISVLFVKTGSVFGPTDCTSLPTLINAQVLRMRWLFKARVSWIWVFCFIVFCFLFYCCFFYYFFGDLESLKVLEVLKVLEILKICKNPKSYRGPVQYGQLIN